MAVRAAVPVGPAVLQLAGRAAVRIVVPALAGHRRRVPAATLTVVGSIAGGPGSGSRPVVARRGDASGRPAPSTDPLALREFLARPAAGRTGTGRARAPRAARAAIEATRRGAGRAALARRSAAIAAAALLAAGRAGRTVALRAVGRVRNEVRRRRYAGHEGLGADERRRCAAER